MDHQQGYAVHHSNITITLPPGVELPEGIPIAAVAYVQAHLVDVYGPMVFG
jgi:hypothetical protein